MPLYEYQCTKCGERAEIIQRHSDPPHSQCAKCGGDMKKLISSPAIQFKGSGFYKTDYASGSKSSGESKSDTKSETKSETKSDSGRSGSSDSGSGSGSKSTD